MVYSYNGHKSIKTRKLLVFLFCGTSIIYSDNIIKMKTFPSYIFVENIYNKNVKQIKMTFLLSNCVKVSAIWCEIRI